MFLVLGSSETVFFVSPRIAEAAQPSVIAEAAQPLGIVQTSWQLGIAAAGQLPEIDKTGQPLGIAEAGQPLGIVEAGQPLGIVEAGQLPAIAAVGQQPEIDEAGQPPAIDAAGQLPVIAAAPIVAKQHSLLKLPLRGRGRGFRAANGSQPGFLTPGPRDFTGTGFKGSSTLVPGSRSFNPYDWNDDVNTNLYNDLPPYKDWRRESAERLGNKFDVLRLPKDMDVRELV
ncbi:circumsporozoite protein-like [Nasonia vitripennis]|uniref:Uncharacterized protein n=1 Tax=Nasonia vitripennis TaxID=7425 RepID=A0A7M7T8W4_NASVI|nr:circumsporozoite protein-like [Nasonia vitripennis]